MARIFTIGLKGNAREAARPIVKQLDEEDGFERIIAELDKVYLKDETMRVFCAIKSFIKFRGESGQGYAKFKWNSTVVIWNSAHAT